MKIKKNELKLLKEKATYSNRIYICGMGEWGKLIGKWFELNKFDNMVFVDKGLKGTDFLGGKIIDYSEIVYSDENMYIIASLYWKESIKESLFLNEVLNESIVEFEDLFALEQLLYEVKDTFPYKEKYLDISRIQNIHSNDRAFIIGNGPSLTVSDLNKLQNEICFATNEIFHVYSKTKWRPTYYFIEDVVGARDNFSNEKEFKNMINQSEKVFCNIKTIIYDKYASGGCENILFYRLYEQKNENGNKILFSDDLVKGVYGLGTTLYSMYQFAAYMGIKELYLIGVDFNFRNIINEAGKLVTNINIKNHADFINENTKRPPLYAIDDIHRAHLMMKQYADAHGIKIYNATRGGKLEVFERVDFDSLF